MGFFSFIGDLIVLSLCLGGLNTAMLLIYKAYMRKQKKEVDIVKLETKADVQIAKQQRHAIVDSARAGATGTIVKGAITGTTAALVTKNATDTIKEISNTTKKEKSSGGELVPLSAKEQLRKQLG